MIGLQTIAVDRRDRNSREHVREQIGLRAKDPRFPRVLIFPEGTVSDGTGLLQFKRGAFEPGLPIQPVAVQLPWQRFDPSFVDTGPGMPELVLRTLAGWNNRMVLHWLPVHHPTEAERADADLYAEAVRKSIAQALQIRTTDYSFDDVIMTMHAAQLGYPPTKAAVAINQLRAECDIHPRDARTLIDVLAAADPHHQGGVSFEAFRRCLLALPPVPGHSGTEEQHKHGETAPLLAKPAGTRRNLAQARALADDVDAVRHGLRSWVPSGYSEVQGAKDAAGISGVWDFSAQPTGQPHELWDQLAGAHSDVVLYVVARRLWLLMRRASDEVAPFWDFFTGTLVATGRGPQRMAGAIQMLFMAANVGSARTVSCEVIHCLLRAALEARPEILAVARQAVQQAANGQARVSLADLQQCVQQHHHAVALGLARWWACGLAPAAGRAPAATGKPAQGSAGVMSTEAQLLEAAGYPTGTPTPMATPAVTPA